MNRVLARLWIGDSEDFKLPLGTLGFSGVLDLRDGHGKPNYGRDVVVYSLANRDGDPWQEYEIENALDFISDKIQLGNVLVACTAGMSRSASMTVGFLVRCGWDAVEALVHVREARPQILPVPKMLQCVLAAVEAGIKR